ncbi:OsmC family protein [Aeromicrobium panaciterrae]|uniref:OsmC family protein n=1 Tax=Aeromicrobium panaciterrae TaxID=363861 RepID=UPI0031D63483
MGIRAEFRTIPGTQAAEGRSGDSVVIADRPAGVAGGRGTGLNGGQLLALSIGGCLSNDVRYVAADQGVELDDVAVDVDLVVEDGRVTSADVAIRLTAAADVDVDAVVARAVEISTVLAAVRSGFPVSVS